MNYMKQLISACAALLAGLTFASAALAEVPGPLVDPAWLAANKDKVLILDVRKDTKSFTAEGHIPGAILIPWGEVRTTKTEDGVELVGMLPGKEAFNALMQKYGVNNDSSIVIVSRGQNAPQVAFATRLYWQLKYYGHDDMALLNGGLAAWQAAKMPLSQDVAMAPPKGNFTASAERRELLATTADVEKAVKEHSAGLFDARDYGQYLGLFYKKKILTEGGHIPGGKFAGVDSFLAHSGPKTFDPISELQAAMKGIGAEGPSVAFCNTGHMASGTWFVMHELAGNENAALYDGSMHAWTQTGHHAVAYAAE